MFINIELVLNFVTEEAIIKMDLGKLIELQDIDKKLIDLDKVKGDLPETVQKLKKQLAINTDNLLKSKNELEEAQKAKRTNESEIEGLYDKLIKYQEKSYSVKTNKQYDAITVEIETIENKTEESEKKKSDFTQQVENHEKEVPELEKQVADLEIELAKKQAELEKKISQTEAEELRLKKEREEISKQIDKKLLANYNRIRNGTNGIALSEVMNHTCSECFGTIPAQTALEVRMMDKLILCELCGRILVSTKKYEKQLVLTT